MQLWFRGLTASRYIDNGGLLLKSAVVPSKSEQFLHNLLKLQFYDSNVMATLEIIIRQ